MYENLMEEVVSSESYGKALKAVIANDGSPGIDGMTTEELNGHLLKHWPKIHAKLMEGNYVPSPVRRKEIRKESGGTRKLGIPTVLDRLIQQILLHARTPTWEPRYSEHRQHAVAEPPEFRDRQFRVRPGPFEDGFRFVSDKSGKRCFCVSLLARNRHKN